MNNRGWVRSWLVSGWVMAGMFAFAMLPACDGDDSSAADRAGEAGEEGAVPVPPKGSRPGLRSIEREVFLPSCAMSSCHGAPSPRKELNLVPPVHARIVDQPSREVPSRKLAAPGEPGASYLFEKISQDAPQVGKRMPPSQPLEQSRIDEVREWIAAGAKDD